MPLQNLNETRCVIDEEGSVFKERIVRTKVSIDEDACVDELSQGNTTKIPNLLELPDKSIVGASVQMSRLSVDMTFTIEITELVLTTTYNLDGGIMTPTFNGKPEANIPILPIIWNVSKATDGVLRLFLMVRICKGSYGFFADDHRLVSVSSDKRLWRMPLPNVHSDCRVCTGKYESKSNTAVGAVINAFNQFKSSSWNSDLLESDEKTKSFFRFNPIEDKFETLVTESDPLKLCECVSAPELENLAYEP